MVTPRLTAPQMDVLRALDKLPEGEWVSPEEGGFSQRSAEKLGEQEDPLMLWALTSGGKLKYRLTRRGDALIAKLKAEGQW